MKRLTLAVVLACVLSGVAQAGEIPSTGATAPQPPSTVSSTLLTIFLIISDTVR